MTRERNAHANSHADRLPSTIGGMTKLAYARAKAAGIALEPLLRTAGLTSHQIEDPQTVIRVRDQIKFLNLVAAALKDDLLGFHLAQTADLRELGLLYYLLASSETLIDALHRAARYSSIVNEGVSLRCVDSRFVRISFHCIGIGRHLDTHQIECTMTTVVRICRQLTGLRLLPDRVRLMHHRPRNAEFAKFFGSNVEFGAAADDVTFSNNIRQSPITSADPYLNRLLISYCEEAISYRPRTRGSFRSSGRKCRCSAAAARQGTRQRDCPATRSKPANACPAAVGGRADILRTLGQSSIGPRQSSSGRPGLGHFPNCMAAWLSRRRRILACLQALDRQGAR